MCVHCEWLIKACSGMVAAADVYEGVAMNSPRHTPETRAGFTAGAVGIVANQAFFQALRTRNPAPLESLLAVVLDWARQNLEVWPFQLQNPTHPGEIPPDAANTVFAGLNCPDGRPSGADPAVLTVLERLLPAEHMPHGQSRNSKLYRRWGEGRDGNGGEWPTGYPFAETVESYHGFVSDRAAKLAETKGGEEAGKAIADELGKLFGVPIQLHRLSVPVPGKKKKGKKHKRKHKGK